MGRLGSIALWLFAVRAAGAAEPWQPLAPGLDIARFQGAPTDVGDRAIEILRIDPARYRLALASAAAPGEGKARTAKQWATRAGAAAAINASMFRDDQKTSVSWMRSRGFVNNPRRSGDKSVLAFGPATTGPQVRLLDADCDDLDSAAAGYETAVQSIRMVTCKRANAWKQQPRRWSTAAIGTDGKGRVLFIHCRTPYTVHDLIDRLLALPIDLRRAMYVEGGPEATLYVKAGKVERDFVGSFESGFLENDDNQAEWALPNVVLAIPR